MKVSLLLLLSTSTVTCANFFFIFGTGKAAIDNDNVPRTESPVLVEDESRVVEDESRVVVKKPVVVLKESEDKDAAAFRAEVAEYFKQKRGLTLIRQSVDEVSTEEVSHAAQWTELFTEQFNRFDEAMWKAIETCHAPKSFYGDDSSEESLESVESEPIKSAATSSASLASTEIGEDGAIEFFYGKQEEEPKAEEDETFQLVDDNEAVTID